MINSQSLFIRNFIEFKYFVYYLKCFIESAVVTHPKNKTILIILKKSDYYLNLNHEKVYKRHTVQKYNL